MENTPAQIVRPQKRHYADVFNGPSQSFGVVTVQVLDSSFYPRRFAMVSDYDRINLSNNNMNNSIFDGMNDALTEFK